MSTLLVPALAMVAPSGTGPGKWITLFDGKTTQGWHSYNQPTATGWRVEEGTLTPDGTGGDLVTDREFENFELEFEFKIPTGSNSGVLYKVLEQPEIKRTVFSAPEYQIIDDTGYAWRDAQGNPRQVDANGQPLKLKPTQLTGANYDLHPPTDATAAKPAGTWNKGRIVVQNNQVQHYLNGKKVVDYTYGNDAWQAQVAQSKFAEWPYATPRAKGKIALQNHNVHEPVWYRRIRIREL
nr:DUF1080 domain-containing protein [Rhabdobacter roseus]